MSKAMGSKKAWRRHEPFLFFAQALGNTEAFKDLQGDYRVRSRSAVDCPIAHIERRAGDVLEKGGYGTLSDLFSPETRDSVGQIAFKRYLFDLPGTLPGEIELSFRTLVAAHAVRGLMASFRGRWLPDSNDPVMGLKDIVAHAIELGAAASESGLLPLVELEKRRLQGASLGGQKKKKLPIAQQRARRFVSEYRRKNPKHSVAAVADACAEADLVNPKTGNPWDLRTIRKWLTAKGKAG